ncbi:hypothetical protein LZ016_00075 [Sphingomonas sp. SM33]|uniref:Uncharacterized protein n=1 Tax=Sphingomonas telluris TaxID=2907998 RepID=A0ABS9VHQ5_9SPHN|nr:hypothetical protein [Sphingomonas telluris]MCH8614506.1 hypothetical protein [Sphingomonas telluris]
MLSAAFTLAALAYALPGGAMDPLVLGIRLVKSAILIAVASVLIWRRQRDPVAGILALAFLCWTVTSSVDFTSGQVLPMLLDRLRFLLFALALVLFPDGKWNPRWTRAVAVASVAVFVIGALEGVGLAPTKLFLPLAIACVVAAIASLIQRFRTTSSETLQLQLKWVALGLVCGVGLILSARAGAALSGPRLGFEAMFQLGIVIVALGFLVPLLRYRLYDAETVISRSAGYAMLTATLVAVFAGSEALIENLGQQYLGSGIGQVSGAMAAALAAVMLAPLNERISRWAEHRFQRDLVRLKRELPELLAETPFDWSPRQIGEAVLPRICDAVHATSAGIIIRDQLIASNGVQPTDTGREAFESALELPLRCPFGGEQGSLLVGPRPDRTSYGKEEVRALQGILPPLRRALNHASQRDETRRREAARKRSIATRIAQMSKQIAALEMIG